MADEIDLSEMDYVRGAIANAQAEGLTLDDLEQMAEYAEDGERFDAAVNELVRTLNG